MKSTGLPTSLRLPDEVKTIYKKAAKKVSTKHAEVTSHKLMVDDLKAASNKWKRHFDL